MPYEFRIRENDTRPTLSVTLVSDADGIPHNLTGATVVFSMSSIIGGTPKISEAAVTVVSAINGQVRYDWQAIDTDTLGTFYGEFEVTFADGTILTFPEKDSNGTGGYIEIEIFAEVA